VGVTAFGYYGHFRARDAIDSVRAQRSRSRVVRSLHRAIANAGGARFLRHCGSPSARFGFQSTIAWDLGVPVGVVGFRPNHDFRVRPHVVFFSQAARARLGPGQRLLGAAPPWRVIGVRARCAPRTTQ
jgi:hypothetical protein